MFPERSGLIVWVNDTKLAKNLDRVGNLIYVSNRCKYAVLYINKQELDSKIKYLEKLRFVKKIEMSNLEEIKKIYEQII